MAPFSWNFPGAYVVILMTGVAASAGIYSSLHFIKDSPDFKWRKDLRNDELAETDVHAQRAESMKHGFFRWLAEFRNRDEPGKDTRIFR